MGRFLHNIWFSLYISLLINVHNYIHISNVCLQIRIILLKKIYKTDTFKLRQGLVILINENWFKSPHFYWKIKVILQPKTNLTSYYVDFNQYLKLRDTMSFYFFKDIKWNQMKNNEYHLQNQFRTLEY